MGKSDSLTLRAVVAHDDKSLERYETTMKALREKLSVLGLVRATVGLPYMSQCCEPGTYEHTSGYAKKVCKGTLIKELWDLSALQVSMLVDGGYSHFGGDAFINNDTGYFRVTIYTD